MYQVVSTMNEKSRKYNFDTRIEATSWINTISKWNSMSNIQLIHYTNPIKPSLAPVRGTSGYHKDVFN